jgi:hypothetical protein
MRINRRTFFGGLAAAATARVCAGPATSFLADRYRNWFPYADGKLIDGEPPLPGKRSFTIAVLPDSQFYSESFPETYLAQTRWIVEQQQNRNIACVLQLGDVTNHNTTAEWENAGKALAQLDKARIPYFFAPGNHDYGEDGFCEDRTTGLNDYFPPERFKCGTTFGATYDMEPKRMDNSYHLFSAGDRDFVALCLEFGPRADVVRWANSVADKFPKREIILVTHVYLYNDNTRYDWQEKGDEQDSNPHSYDLARGTEDDVADGEELWQKLVNKHRNFILTLNGHVTDDGLGMLTSTTPAGHDVAQMLVNYQMRPRGGDGWLRLLEFTDDGKTVEVYDYSPTRRQMNVGQKNRFAFKTTPSKQA